MDRVECDDTVHITVAFSPRAGVVDEVALVLQRGATVGDALRESAMAVRHPEVNLAPLAIGVWGVLRSTEQALRDHDRVEILRPLKVDPKQARRLRYRAQRGTR